jgi:hypothetical protein
VIGYVPGVFETAAIPDEFGDACRPEGLASEIRHEELNGEWRVGPAASHGAGTRLMSGRASGGASMMWLRRGLSGRKSGRRLRSNRPESSRVRHRWADNRRLRIPVRDWRGPSAGRLSEAGAQSVAS